MERSITQMLSRLDSISHIMPYYGQTHRAFLLLSGLCSKTRRKLDEFYYAFVCCMKEYWMFVKKVEWNKSNYLFLPNDLFEFHIMCLDKEMFGVFIKFIENLRDCKGWYFNSHYMHSNIKIRDHISVSIKFIKELYPYIDTLKSTQVTLCKWGYPSSKFRYESDTLDTNCNYALLILKRTYINVHCAFKFYFLLIIRRFYGFRSILF